MRWSVKIGQSKRAKGKLKVLSCQLLLTIRLLAPSHADFSSCLVIGDMTGRFSAALLNCAIVHPTRDEQSEVSTAASELPHRIFNRNRLLAPCMRWTTSRLPLLDLWCLPFFLLPPTSSRLIALDVSSPPPGRFRRPQFFPLKQDQVRHPRTIVSFLLRQLER